MKYTIALAVLLSVAGASYGQDKPLPAARVPYLSSLKQARAREGATPKPWYKSKTVIGGLAVIGGGITADAVTTAMRGRHSESNSVFLGSNPSNGRIAGISAANFAVQSTVEIFAYKLTHSPIQFSDGSVAQQDKLGWRIFSGTAIPAEVIALNVRNAVNNLKYDK